MPYVYEAEVSRTRYQETGPGTFTLYRIDLVTGNHDVLGQWDVITGDSIIQETFNVEVSNSKAL